MARFPSLPDFVNGFTSDCSSRRLRPDLPLLRPRNLRVGDGPGPPRLTYPPGQIGGSDQPEGDQHYGTDQGSPVDERDGEPRPCEQDAPEVHVQDGLPVGVPDLP